MIFTLTDRQYNVLDAYETEDYLIGSYIGSIIKTLDMDVLVNSANAEEWVEGNYILCEDASGCRYWFTIYDAEDAHGDDQKKLTCYSGTIDIVSEDAIPIAMPATPQPFSWYFGQIFFDTGITIGINELEGMTRSLEFTSENASNAEMLQYVLNGFDNAEADLAVEFSGSVPIKVVLNVFRRLGNSEPQTLLSDEDDSVTMLERTGSISGLATCLNPIGNGEDPDNPLTLIGKYYEERDEDGELLYYSPTDHERVYSVKGRERFFVEIPGKTNGEFDGYINRRYQSQASTQDALWSESLAQLKKIDQPAVTYEAKGHINCRLGDTIQIVSNEMKPPVMISARVLEYKFNDDIPELNEYKFGNYAILESNIEDMSAMLAELKKSLVIVSSVEVLYAVDNQGITPPTSGWLASYVSPEPGNWLWTKTVTYLSNSESSVAYSVSRVGEDGATGPAGPKGADGLTPIKGVDYFDGVDGQNGQSSYLWVRYSQNANGNPMSSNPAGALYIGIATTTANTAPTSYAAYSWSLIKGADGVAGETGADGKTSYLHIKYSDDGGSTFTANNGETVGAWIGTYVDFIQSDSTSVSSYTWNRVKGEKGDPGLDGLQGPQGSQGIQGPAGANGLSSYTHIAYATNATGTTGFSTSDSTNKTYIGMYTDFTAADSSNPALYNWTLIKGADGSQGIQGPKGADGLTPYLHIAYATNGTGTTGFSTTDSVGKTYIGQYTDFASADSTNPASYSWTLIKGDTGPQGIPGPTGPPTGIVEQSTAPTSPYVGMLWKDTDDGITRRWNGSAWTIFLFHADNISATNLAAIAANLGTITAGILQSADGTTKLDLNAKTLALGSKFNWDGTNLNIRGNVLVDDDLFMWAPSSIGKTAGLHARVENGLYKLYIGWLPELASGDYSEYYFGSPGQVLNKFTFGGNLFVNGTGGNVYTTNKKPTLSELGAEAATIVGSSASGKYIKFADGTMICYNRLVVNSLAITAGWGSWFISALLSYTFPATFFDNPVVSVNVESTSGDIAIWAPQATTTTGFNGRFTRGAAATFNSVVAWKAIGRWK